MMDVAKTSDAAGADWERFRRRLQELDYRKLVEWPILQLLRYVYDAGWTDGRAASKQPAPASAPVAHEHDGEFHKHEGGRYFHVHHPDIPPGWEPAYLEG